MMSLKRAYMKTPLKVILLAIMNNSKPHVFLHEIYSLVARCDLRVILSILLFVYTLYSFGEWQDNSSKHKEILGSLNILKQMQEYAKQHCQKATDDHSSNVDRYLKVLQRNKRGKLQKIRLIKKLHLYYWGQLFTASKVKLTG